MTLRAVIIGLIGAGVVTALAYANDMVLDLTNFVGNFLPVSVFGSMVVFVLLGNPLLGRLKPAWAFTSGELAVVLVMACVACSVPSYGLMRMFIPSAIVPIQVNSVTPGWQRSGALQYAPPSMLVSGGRYEPEVIEGYFTGLRRGDRWVGLDKVPWQQWTPPLATWLPLVFALAVAVISLALIVHRQWAASERLRYPVADFMSSLLVQQDGRPAAVLRDKLFWMAVIVIVFIRAINYLNAWFPHSIEIPLIFEFPAIRRAWPLLVKSAGFNYFVQIAIYPVAVAFSFFLASDVGLSLGLARPFFLVLSAVCATAGVTMLDRSMAGGEVNWQMFGGYLGVALGLLYTGRWHYWQTLRAAVSLRRGSNDANPWACRALFIALGAATVWLVRLGLDWPFALMAVLMTLLVFVGMARIVAETGLFWCQAWWYPAGVIFGLFGAEALGPKVVAILCLMNAVLTINPREALMPFVVNGLKICDDFAVKPVRTAWSSVAAYAVALAIAVPVVLWIDYNTGIRNRSDKWSTYWVPQKAYNTVNGVLTELRFRGTLERSQHFSPIERVLHMKPERAIFWWIGGGMAGVFLLGYLRLRYTWWPLHPVLVVVWAGTPIETLGHSFMLGWLIKVLITRVGGSPVYRRAKVFMIGVIAGELLCGLAIMAFNAAYMGMTGTKPPAYVVIP